MVSWFWRLEAEGLSDWRKVCWTGAVVVARPPFRGRPEQAARAIVTRRTGVAFRVFICRSFIPGRLTMLASINAGGGKWWSIAANGTGTWGDIYVESPLESQVEILLQGRVFEAAKDSDGRSVCGGCVEPEGVAGATRP